MATGTSTNVIVGVASTYIAPLGTQATPVAAGATGVQGAQGAQGAAAFATINSTEGSQGWQFSGFTEDGVTLNVDNNNVLIRVEEQPTPVLVTKDTTSVTVDLTFAEDTIANMVYAYGGGTIGTQAPGAKQPGYTTLSLSDSLTQVALQFFGANTFGFVRQVYIPAVISNGRVKTSYRRAKANRSYPTAFEAVCDMPSISIIDLTAVATS
jgi:hypothetical protein